MDEKNTVYDVNKLGFFNVETVETFTSEKEAQRFIKAFCDDEKYGIHPRNLKRVWESVDEYVANTDGAKMKYLQIKWQKLNNYAIEIDEKDAIIEKVTDREKVAANLNSNYYYHTIFAIDEVRQILSLISTEDLEEDGKALIKYPKTNNYALVTKAQYDLLEKALIARLNEIERVGKQITAFNEDDVEIE